MNFRGKPQIKIKPYQNGKSPLSKNPSMFIHTFQNYFSVPTKFVSLLSLNIQTDDNSKYKAPINTSSGWKNKEENRRCNDY